MSAFDGNKRAARQLTAKALKAFDPKLSYRVLPDTKEVEVSITVDQKWGAIAVEVLRFMEQMVRSVDRFSETGFRQIRTEEALVDLEVKYRAILDRYQALRREGIKHRMAVYQLVGDRDLPFHGRWGYADYNWVVRTRQSPPVFNVVKRGSYVARKD